MQKPTVSIIVALMLTTHPFALAQDNSESYNELEKVKRVVIRGNMTVLEKTIKSWISTRRGDTYNPAQLDQDVRTLFDTGNFEDVKVFVEDAEGVGKIIIFDLRERPIVADVIYDMDDSTVEIKIQEELDRHNLKLTQGERYDPVKVRKAAKLMKEELLREGRTKAKVNAFVEEKTMTEVIVTFKAQK